ncbi:MAG: chemotaxis protein CheW [Ignavibacteriales bacterium]
MMNKSDFEKLFNTFLEESAEQFEIIEQEILKLEKCADDEQAINEVFRMAHSLKGSTALMGFENMTKLTHSLEDMLQKVKDKEISINSEIVDILFESLDMLKKMRDSIKNQKENKSIDVSPLIEKIKEFTGTEGQAKSKGPSKNAIEENLQFSEQEKNMIEKAINQGEVVYKIKIEIEEEAIMKSIKSFLIINNLSGIGQLLRVEPENYERLPDMEFGSTLMVILATSENQESIKQQIDVVNEIKDITLMEYNESPNSPEQSVPNEAETVKDTQISSENKDFRQEKRSTIRVDIKKLDKLMSLAGELVIDKERLVQIGTKLRNKYNNDKDVQELISVIPHLDAIGDEIQEAIMAVRMYTIENVFDRFPRMIRDLAHRSGKEINFIMEGKDTELDRSVIEEIVDPIVHLLRNSVDHGIESKEERIKNGKSPIGTIKLEARQEQSNVVIEVSDDGRGIEINKVKQKVLEKGMSTKEKLKAMEQSEILNFIFMPGFSTSASVSELSGRGVGMDVVKTNIEKLNGIIEITSEENKGTKVILKLPLTLAIVDALLIGQGKNKFALPLTSVIETVRLTKKEVEEDFRKVNEKEVYSWRDIVVPVIRLDKFYDINTEIDPEKYFAVIVAFSEKRLCILVERLIGEQQVVIKPLGEYIGKGKILGDIKGISGATILGDGTFALILDIPGILKSIKMHQ